MSNATIEIPRDQTLDYFQVACGAISIFSSAEVLGLAFSTFARYNTLYFKSIVGCATGCILFAGGFLDLFYELYLKDGVTVYRPLFILTFGWYMMVTGFSLVMYSRLHLVSVPPQYIKVVKYMIIFNVIFAHFPTTVLTFGSNIVASPQFVYAYSVMEKLQMTMFCIQEMTLGTLYLIYTRKLRFNKKENFLVKKTLYINCIVLALDFAMLVIQYIDLYNYQIMLKVVVYSIKLKLEFYILNLLSRFLEKNRMAIDGGKGNYIMSESNQTSHGHKHGGKGEVTPAVVSDVENQPESVSDSQANNNNATHD